ncbi:hypothetical protein [Alteribacillus sp. HJP-4]|uniref:hypothetical protein n=1 Tax=Alteribacillus sp. HJP-4 TaxID=2775394 RepID=UPI0035CCDDFA
MEVWRLVMTEKQAAGWKQIEEMEGERGLFAMEELEKFSPRLAKLALEFGYGNVYVDQALTCSNGRS